jgi:ribonuclease VapC
MTELEADTPDDSGAQLDVRTVLDASAVLALLLGEPGAETVADAIADGAAMSSVTHAEVGTVLLRNGRDVNVLARVAEQVLVEPFSVADAHAAAALVVETAGFGLSLGDRACLALATRFHATALTADSTWVQLDVGITITLIRRAEP